MSMTYELGNKTDIKINDFVDLRTSKNIREDLINFYKKDYFNVCKYCVRLKKEVIPAEQL
jgi:hypothetical protein